MTLNDAALRLDIFKERLSGKVIHFGISGGVDSSTLAVLLKLNGLQIRGFHLVCWGEGDQCTAQDDLKDALAVSAKFDIPLDVIDLRVEYKKYVLDTTIKAYDKGNVPNIDILCNEHIKFGFVADRFLLGDDDILSTGHYSSVGTFQLGSESVNTLSVPSDSFKDQTYFLAHILKRENIVDRLFFPAGLFTKSEIRELADLLGLHNAKKPDSQGICFVGNIGMKDFLAPYIVQSPGSVIDTFGNIVGEHSGAKFYAIGQRHGFTIYKYSAEPLYIVQKIIDKNLLVVGPKEQAYFDKVLVNEFFSLVKFSTLECLVKEKKLMVRFRNLGRFVEVQNIACQNDRLNIHVELSEKEFGLTPGQEVVFYSDGLLIAFGKSGS